MSRFMIMVDQGTTNTKAVLIDEGGSVITSATTRVELRFPRPGWAESAADEIWGSVLEVIEHCLDAAPIGSVAAVGIANQRESVGVWDRSASAPIGPIVSWQCTRGIDVAERVRGSGAESVQRLRQSTGLPLDPMFSAPKLRWLLDEIPDGVRRAEDGELCAGTIDSWLVWKLTGGAVFATDTTNASRTMLMSLADHAWDSDACELFGIPSVCLPTIQPSASVFGPVALSHRALHPEAVIAAVAGDSHAAMVGHRGFDVGTVKATFGTGTSVMANAAGMPLRSDLAGTIAWSTTPEVAARTGVVPIRYGVEGNIVATGAALEWTAGVLGMGIDVGALERSALSVDSSAGAVMVPALAGLGAPHWDPSARGTITGLTRATDAAHIALAAFESVGHQVADVLDVLPRVAGTPATELRVDGGAIRSGLLAQLVADICGVPLVRSGDAQVAAIGAGLLSGLVVGFWADVSSLPPTAARTVFEPTWTEAQRSESRDSWREALTRTRSGA